MKESQKIKISVYGARHSDYHKSFDALEQAQTLGALIAEHEALLTIPATSGFPFWVAKGAKKAGATVIGFSPAANESEHHTTYGLPLEYMDVILYSGFGYAGSDLLLSRSSDAIIFGYGGLETIHEFWVAFQEDKPIGILKGDWDTDEILHSLLKGHEDIDQSRIIFDDDPRRLLEQVMKAARTKKLKTHHVI